MFVLFASPLFFSVKFSLIFCHAVSPKAVGAFPDLTPATLVECVMLSCTGIARTVRRCRTMHRIKKSIDYFAKFSAHLSMIFFRPTDTHHQNDQTRKKAETSAS